MAIGDTKRRVVYFCLGLFLSVAEILIALFVRDAFVRPYVGGVLIVILICCFVRGFLPRGTQFLALYVFLFASLVEVVQYFDFSALFGFRHIRFVRILMGTTFSSADLVCYAIGCTLFFVCENLVFTYFAKKRGKK